jgi:ketosteroid isomerase-like protein
MTALDVSLRTTALQYFECVNAEDWSTMRSLWHPDGELIAVGTRPRRGLDDVLDYFEKALRPWREHHDEAIRVLVCAAEEVVVVEPRFRGSTTTGVGVTFDAVDVFDITAGQIRRLSIWYDLERVRKAMARDPHE